MVITRIISSGSGLPAWEGRSTAICNSVDACFYNPAGLALTPGSTISLSASMYGFYNFTVKDGWFPDEDVDIDSFVSIPTTFGSIYKLNQDTAFAFSAFIPDRSSSNDLETFENTSHFFKYNKDDQTLWIGPSISTRITPELSVGVSVFGIYRTFSYFRDYLYGAAGGVSWDIKYHDLSLLSVLGVRYDINEKWSVGVMVQTPAVHLTGDGEFLYKVITPDGVVGEYIPHGDTKNSLPTAIRAGVGCQVPQEYAFGLDLSYHFPTGFDRFTGEDTSGTRDYYHLQREEVFNANLGGEYYVKEHWPVRLGFFTDLSSAPKAELAENPEIESPPHIDKYGVTASIGRETEHTTLNFGINYVWGQGDFYGLDEKVAWTTVSAKETYLYIFLASSYIF